MLAFPVGSERQILNPPEIMYCDLMPARVDNHSRFAALQQIILKKEAVNRVLPLRC